MINILLIILLSAFSLNASTYYVSKVRGDDATGDGSNSTPWKTLGQLNSESIVAGDTVVCADTVSFSGFDPNFSGSSGNTIVLIDSARFAGYTDSVFPTSFIPATIFKTAGGTGINMLGYIELIGFDISNTSSTVMNVADGNKIKDCRIKQSTWVGIYFDYADNCIIEKNIFIQPNGVDNATVLDGASSTGNKFYHNTFRSEDTNTYIIDIDGGSGYDIRNNIFDNAGGFYCFRINNSSTIIDTMDFNVFYTSGTNWWSWDGTTGSSLATLQSTSGQDDNSINSNPNLTNTTTVCDWANGEVQDESADTTILSLNDIGYYQDTETPAGGTPATKKQIKWRNWN